jgi:tripartite-type tricarboxylate transporter receptor subunit TctC
MSAFSAITLVGSSPNILVVHPSLPSKSVSELLALAKAKPGELNYASPGAGGSSHLAAELFKAMGRVDILRIPYSSTGLALTALIAAQVQLMFPATGGAMPHVKAGRLRALAVTSAQPTALAPGLPTVAASGLPGYESVAPYGIFAPVSTPSAVINRLNQEIVRVLNAPDIKEKLFNAGIDVVASTPKQLAAAVEAETARMGKVIKEAGIRAE